MLATKRAFLLSLLRAYVAAQIIELVEARKTAAIYTALLVTLLVTITVHAAI